MAAAKVKRFYDLVSVRRLAQTGVSRFTVTLDGNDVLTPARKPLALPTEELAWAVAAEWEAQPPKQLLPHTMPLMKLSTISIDQVPEIRGTMVDSMVRCLESDAACFRSASEPSLLAKEERHFAPLLGWLSNDLGLTLGQTTSLLLEHPAGALERADELLAAADEWEIATLDSLCSCTKSFVLAMAVCRGRVGAEDACAAARVAEQHQIDEWGEVEAGHDLDEADLALRLSAASAF